MTTTTTAMTPKTAAIIPAAGFGTRMQVDQPKQYLLLDGIPILIRTIRAFLENSKISRVVIAVPREHQSQTVELLNSFKFDQDRLVVTPGGKRRQDSVRAGLDCLDQDTEIVIVHDGARPLVTQALIDRCYHGALQHGAVIAAVPVKDTLKRASSSQKISATVDRSSLWQAQTPQAMRRELLELAYAENGDEDVTDEASLLEKAHIAVHLVNGSETNIKITRPDDLLLAEKILSSETQMKIRIGHGYDAHRFSSDRKLILGGITIPHTHGLIGHSDADVVTHALCDGLLGALGQGDIGKHFPDSDTAFKDIYSIKLLEKVIDFVNNEGFIIGNIDLTIICQTPRLAPYLPAMQELLSKTCRTAPENVNIKATTTEKMGFTGRQEGISSHAVVLLTTSRNREENDNNY